MFMGPYEEALLTGDNGEVLVKDIGKDYYYVPELTVKKDHDLLAKIFNPNEHYAEPYKYDKNGFAIVKKTDGTVCLKWSNGYLSEPYKEYKIDGDYHEYRTIKNELFVKIHDLILQVGIDYPIEKCYEIARVYDAYFKEELALELIPHQCFLNDDFVKAVIKREKEMAKIAISQRVCETEKKLIDVASTDPSNIRTVKISKDDLQKMLDQRSAIIIEKRKIAIKEKEQEEAIAKEEKRLLHKVDDIFDFDNIVDKTTKKPRKKKPVVKSANEEKSSTNPVVNSGNEMS